MSRMRVPLHAEVLPAAKVLIGMMTRSSTSSHSVISHSALVFYYSIAGRMTQEF